MKKRLVSLAVALCMMFSLIPFTAFAESDIALFAATLPADTEYGALVLDREGVPILHTGVNNIRQDLTVVNGIYTGNGWIYDAPQGLDTATLYLLRDFDFSNQYYTASIADHITVVVGRDAPKASGSLKNATVEGDLIIKSDSRIENVICNGTVTNEGTISSGSFKGDVKNDGTINSGDFTGHVDNNKNGTISDGTFNGTVTNGGTINDGMFNETVENNGTIHDGTFNKDVANNGIIDGGTFKDTVTNNKDGEIDNGTFDGTVKNDGAISNGDFNNVENNQNGSISNGSFKGDVKNDGAISGGDFNGHVDNDENGSISDGTFNGSVTNGGTINDGTFNETVENNGTIHDGTFNKDVANNGIIDGGTFKDTVTNNKDGEIDNGTFNGTVKNDGTINGGNFNNSVENGPDGSITNGNFKGDVKNDGAISGGDFTGNVDNNQNGSISDGNFKGDVKNDGAISGGDFTGNVDNNQSGSISDGNFKGDVDNKGDISGGDFSGKVDNDGNISGGDFDNADVNNKPGSTFQPSQKPDNGPDDQPDPDEPETLYTITIEGGTINGKSKLTAKSGEELTVMLDKSAIPDGMVFDLWSFSSNALTGDLGVNYKAESVTFRMPAEDLLIRAQYRSAEIFDPYEQPESSSISPLGVAVLATAGATATGIALWQGYQLGIDLYLEHNLPAGTPVPTNRRELVLLMWRTAGQPDVELSALYSDLDPQDTELAKAAQWAADYELMETANEYNTALFDPDGGVTKIQVFHAWRKLSNLLSLVPADS